MADTRTDQTLTSAASNAETSRVRYRVVAFAMALAAVTYLDRVCISIVAPDIMRDLGLTTIQMSYVFSAFTLAYAGFEIPTAWWADKVGSRRVLTRIVLWWSAFTMATAGAFSYVSMLVVRFLFGIGEAGAWPNAARVFSRWIPARERGRVQGIFFAGAHLSGGLTPMLVAYMATFLHWRVIFLIFGCVGVVWALSWHWWFRDEPRDHVSVSRAECDLSKAPEGCRRVTVAHGAMCSARRVCFRSVFNTSRTPMVFTSLSLAPDISFEVTRAGEGRTRDLRGYAFAIECYCGRQGGMTTMRYPGALGRVWPLRRGRRRLCCRGDCNACGNAGG